jgi:hypothetical protein
MIIKVNREPTSPNKVYLTTPESNIFIIDLLNRALLKFFKKKEPFVEFYSVKGSPSCYINRCTIYPKSSANNGRTKAITVLLNNT